MLRKVEASFSKHVGPMSVLRFSYFCMQLVNFLFVLYCILRLFTIFRRLKMPDMEEKRRSRFARVRAVKVEL